MQKVVSIPTRCDQNLLNWCCGNTKELVSIPTRCDQNLIFIDRGRCRRLVSIPTRCDQNWNVGRAGRNGFQVSIPTRCDQNTFPCYTSRLKLLFQFRHGAIKTDKPPSACAWNKKFQFRHGAIKTRLYGLKSAAARRFNSDTVRSKPISRSHTTKSVWFQFRHGAIKTDDEEEVRLREI